MKRYANLKNQISNFYLSQLSEGKLILSSKESHHCIRSLRHQINDIITIVDGNGKSAQARILDDNPKNCKIEVFRIETHKLEVSNKIHIAIAPTKNIKRFEWFMEKAMEIGIGKVTPIICQNSERRTINTDRLKQKALTALKQSLQTFLVEINDPVFVDEFILRNDSGGKFICHLNEDSFPDFKEYIPEKNGYNIMIGPEGGFTEEEIQLAESHKFKKVSLGDKRYRTETAGILACHIVNLLHYD